MFDELFCSAYFKNNITRTESTIEQKLLKAKQ